MNAPGMGTHLRLDVADARGARLLTVGHKDDGASLLHRAPGEQPQRGQDTCGTTAAHVSGLTPGSRGGDQPILLMQGN